MPPQQPTPPAFTPIPGKSKAPLLAVIFGVLLVAALAFGAWAYQGRSTYKDGSDQKASAAASAAAAAQQKTDQASFDEQLKQPYKSYVGPATYGSVKFSYPKTWSVYADQSSSSEPINDYFHPQIVPGTSTNAAYALRVELVSDTYSNVINDFSGQLDSGAVKAQAYVPARLTGNKNVQRGTRLDGTINSGQTGAMIVIPVRDSTLKVYTESTDYLPDFNKIVLPSLTFSP